jgi:hypothetical protein
MPSTVTRLYATQDAAENAWKELRRQRYSLSDIHLVHAPADGADPVPAIVEAGISRHRAHRYAERLKQGGALVVVHPPFGTAAVAEEVLDSFEPVATGVPDRDYASDADFDDDATPFSRWLGWTVLLRNSPSPFSDTIGWNTLAKPDSRSYPASIPLPLLGGSAAPLSKMLGLPVLTKHGDALTAGKEVDRLSANPAPFSGLFKLKTLLSTPTVLGHVNLVQDPAPFSNLLHLPVLTKHQR